MLVPRRTYLSRLIEPGSLGCSKTSGLPVALARVECSWPTVSVGVCPVGDVKSFVVLYVVVGTGRSPVAASGLMAIVALVACRPAARAP